MRRTGMCLAVLAVLVVATGAFASDWTFQSQRSGSLTSSGYLSRVNVVDNDTFFAVGSWYEGIDLEPGLVFNSVDQGVNVTEVLAVNVWPFGPGGFCRALISVNDLTFTSGTTGLIFGGWGGSYTDCGLLTAQTPWIANTNSGGGALDTWTATALAPVTNSTKIMAVAWLDATNAVAAGDPEAVFRTSNAGASWETLAAAPEVYEDMLYVSASMPTSNDIYLAGETFPEYEYYAVGGDDDGDDDAGDDDIEWTKDFEDLNGYVGALVYSNNAGASWQTLLTTADLEAPFTDAVGFHKVQFHDAETGWLLAANAEEGLLDILYTTDGGETWMSSTLPSIPGVGDAGDAYMIADFEFLNAAVGWAVGYDYDDHSVILYTDDGGVSWGLDDYTGNGALLAVDFLDARNAYAVGDKLTVVRFFREENTPPVADAGPDQDVAANSIVDLDGTGSYDPDGDEIETWTWTQESGPTVGLSGADTSTPSFTAVDAGEYVFRLVVHDGIDPSIADTVTVTVGGGGDGDDDDDDDDDDTGDDDGIGGDDDAGGDDDDDDDDDGGCCG
ncbi:MAG: PKD domain-containing protein [Deltaproteobacteria bacterium]|nr:PKD domain-containing protein [Deltaproteobacteria bacterium]